MACAGIVCRDGVAHTDCFARVERISAYRRFVVAYIGGRFIHRWNYLFCFRKSIPKKRMVWNARDVSSFRDERQFFPFLVYARVCSLCIKIGHDYCCIFAKRAKFGHNSFTLQKSCDSASGESAFGSWLP